MNGYFQNRLNFSILADIYNYMKIRTELLECLVQRCVREVLDQINEDADVSKLKSSGIGDGDDKEPVKQKVTVNPFKKGKKNVTKINEEEDKPENKPDDKSKDPSQDPSSPEKGPEAAATPPTPPTPDAAATPSLINTPPRIPKGASVINPKDKSKLTSVKWTGHDESSVERVLHQVAVSMAGSRAKVSLGAKRMGREAARNPKLPIYFYFGKMDPESEEIFLMADKSLQIAKDDSVQPGDIMGTPVSTPSPNLNYTAMTDQDYETHMKRRNLPSPRYGIDDPADMDDPANPANIGEGAKKLIKKMVNQILNS